MNSPQYIPSFYFYKFAQGVSEPYTSLQAYRGGAIDQNGNILKAESSIDPLEYLIIKLKKIFDELPPGLTKAKLNNYMSTMQLFGEEVKQIGITDSEYIGLVESYIALHIDPSISYMELCEDMAAGGMGTPGTSPGYNTGSVSGYDPAMGTTKRTTPILKGLDNCEMFDVCPEEMSHFKGAKAWKHVPDSETKNYLQRYQRRNPKSHMAVRSVDPDTGESDLYWIQFKPLSFMEEYGLEELDILNEEYDVLVEAVTPKDMHDKFAQHLENKGLQRIKSPDLQTRRDAKALQLFHESIPHGSFYVGEDPNEGHGHDAYVKIDDETHGGIELKKSSLSKPRNKKPSHHGAMFGIAKDFLLKIAKRYGREKEVGARPSFLKTAFNGLTDFKTLQQIVERGAHKEIERKGDLIIAGDTGGVHVLSSSRHKSSAEKGIPLYDRHSKLAEAIGLSLTGNIKDWGRTLGTGFKKARPRDEQDKGISLKTRVELKPIPDDHHMRDSYVNNSGFLN